MVQELQTESALTDLIAYIVGEVMYKWSEGDEGGLIETDPEMQDEVLRLLKLDPFCSGAYIAFTKSITGDIAWTVPTETIQDEAQSIADEIYDDWSRYGTMHGFREIDPASRCVALVKELESFPDMVNWKFVFEANDDGIEWAAEFPYDPQKAWPMSNHTLSNSPE